MMRVLGGREIHPVNVRAGGFYRVPSACGTRSPRRKSQASPRHRRRSRSLGRRRFRSRNSSRTTNSWRCAIRANIPFNEGRLVSNRDIDIDIADYETEFEERHVAHSTALHSVVKRRGAYLVGPLARYALNFDHLPASVQALAREAGLGAVCKNPFQSIIVRAIEIVYACEEALRVIEAYEPPDVAALPVEARGGHRVRLHRSAARHLLAPV